MTLRTKVTAITLGAMVPLIAAIFVALRMLIIANASETVPAFYGPLIVCCLLMNVALMGWAGTLRRKLPPRHQ